VDIAVFVGLGDLVCVDSPSPPQANATAQKKSDKEKAALKTREFTVDM
jgi:hypothetical protein